MTSVWWFPAVSARRKFLSRRFVGLFVDGITKIDDDRETEPDDVCDANSGGGMYGEKKISYQVFVGW